MGFVVNEEYLTKVQTIITMPADRFLKFSRKFGSTEGQQVEVANGWVFPLNKQAEKNPYQGLELLKKAQGAGPQIDQKDLIEGSSHTTSFKLGIECFIELTWFENG